MRSNALRCVVTFENTKSRREVSSNVGWITHNYKVKQHGRLALLERRSPDRQALMYLPAVEPGILQ